MLYLLLWQSEQNILNVPGIFDFQLWLCATLVLCEPRPTALPHCTLSRLRDNTRWQEWKTTETDMNKILIYIKFFARNLCNQLDTPLCFRVCGQCSVQTSSEAARSWSSPLWLLVGTPSAIDTELARIWAERSLSCLDVIIYIFKYIFVTYAVCESVFMTSPLGMAVGLLYILGGLFTKLELYFRLITRLSWGVGSLARKPVNHASWVAVVTSSPTDRP